MENREEILTKLYGIRAGISAISVQKDKLTQVQNRIKSCNDTVTAGRESLNRKQSEHLNRISKYEDDISRLSQILERKNEELKHVKFKNAKSWWQRFKKVSEDSIFSFGLFIFLFVLGGSSFVTGIVLFAKDSSNGTNQYYFAFMPLLFFGGIIGLISGIRMFFRFGIYLRRAGNIEYSDRDHIISDIESFNKQLQTAKKELEEEKSRLSKIPENELVYTVKKREMVLQVSELQSTGRMIKRYSGNLYDVLVQEYSSFLSVGDWRQLDYIIYLFETGRADSIKESLQLLDDMKRHVELMQVMNHISQAIHVGFNVLNSNMMRCFSNMSSRLDSISGQLDSMSGQINSMSGQLGTMQKMQKAQSELTQGLADKVDFHRALLSKANETSEKMADDIQYIKKAYI